MISTPIICAVLAIVAAPFVVARVYCWAVERQAAEVEAQMWEGQ